MIKMSRFLITEPHTDLFQRVMKLLLKTKKHPLGSPPPTVSPPVRNAAKSKAMELL